MTTPPSSSRTGATLQAEKRNLRMDAVNPPSARRKPFITNKRASYPITFQWHVSAMPDKSDD